MFEPASLLFCWFDDLIILRMDHLAKDLGAAIQQLSAFRLRSTNATVFHFIWPGRKTGGLQRPELKSSRKHGHGCSHRRTKLKFNSISLTVRQPTRGDDSPQALGSLQGLNRLPINNAGGAWSVHIAMCLECRTAVTRIYKCANVHGQL